MSTTESNGIMHKLNRISSYLNSFQAESTERGSSLPDIGHEISDNSHQETSILSETEDNVSSPNSPVLVANNIRKYYAIVKNSLNDDLSTFGERLQTFGEKGWFLPTSDISVYEFVRRGWYIHKPSLMQCTCCKEMLSVKLPEDFTCDGYNHALSLLKERLVTKHKDTCQFISTPSSESLCKPPSVLSPPDFFVLSEAAHVLVNDLGGDKLPFFDFSALLTKMEFDQNHLSEIWGNSCNDLEVTALMLVLTGWKKSSIVNAIRCELCKRDVALKSFVSFNEHLSSEPQQQDNSNEDDEQSQKNGEINEQENSIKSTDDSSEQVNENNKRCRSDDDEETNETKRKKMEIDENKTTFSKLVFCPLSQHRYWCAWINATGKDLSNSEGYTVINKQIKTTLQLAGTNNWINSPKYSSTVEGLRNVRALLTGWMKQ